jgi:hypothetical protein
MRYDKLGNALLHKLGRGASFAEVYLTAVELGYSIESKGANKVLLRRTTGTDSKGWINTRTETLPPEEVVDFLNQRMVDEGVIKEEIPE